MFVVPGLRVFSLAAGRDSGGVSCDAHGVFVDGVPLLRRERESDRNEPWTVRPLAELNEELSARYRLPVDITAKAGALALIAKALNRDDLAMAAFATVQMQFPDPPLLTKGAESAGEIMQRALELHRSRLLKAEWDPTKHPRTGTPPNRAWFAPVPKETRIPDARPRSTGWPLPHVSKLARQFVKLAARFIEENAGRVLLAGFEINPVVDVFIAVFTPEELNGGEDRLTAQLKAALDTPKTLDELQQSLAENFSGYEKHHIVEQNPANLEKIVLEKFGRERIDDPSNLANVPRFPHEDIGSDYSETLFGPGTPTVRDLVSRLGYEQQREIGLMFMRKYRVLK
jgi:hypothetical protein